MAEQTQSQTNYSSDSTLQQLELIRQQHEQTSRKISALQEARHLLALDKQATDASTQQIQEDRNQLLFELAPRLTKRNKLRTAHRNIQALLSKQLRASEHMNALVSHVTAELETDRKEYLMCCKDFELQLKQNAEMEVETRAEAHNSATMQQTQRLKAKSAEIEHSRRHYLEAYLTELQSLREEVARLQEIDADLGRNFDETKAIVSKHTAELAQLSSIEEQNFDLDD